MYSGRFPPNGNAPAYAQVGAGQAPTNAGWVTGMPQYQAAIPAPPTMLNSGHLNSFASLTQNAHPNTLHMPMNPAAHTQPSATPGYAQQYTHTSALPGYVPTTVPQQHTQIAAPPTYSTTTAPAQLTHTSVPPAYTTTPVHPQHTQMYMPPPAASPYAHAPAQPSYTPVPTPPAHHVYAQSTYMPTPAPQQYPQPQVATQHMPSHVLPHNMQPYVAQHPRPAHTQLSNIQVQAPHAHSAISNTTISGLKPATENSGSYWDKSNGMLADISSIKPQQDAVQELTPEDKRFNELDEKLTRLDINYIAYTRKLNRILEAYIDGKADDKQTLEAKKRLIGEMEDDIKKYNEFSKMGYDVLQLGKALRQQNRDHLTSSDDNTDSAIDSRKQLFDSFGNNSKTEQLEVEKHILALEQGKITRPPKTEEDIELDAAIKAMEQIKVSAEPKTAEEVELDKAIKAMEKQMSTSQ